MAKKEAINPFIINKDFELKVVEVFNRSIINKGGRTGYVEQTSKFLIEQQSAVSFYKIGNSAVTTNYLFTMLTNAGRDLLWYIIANIGDSRDYIKLDRESICKAIGVGNTYYYKGLSELREASIITPKKNTEYWINPYFIFRGDRLEYYEQNCKDCIKVVGKATTGDSLIEHVLKD
jgi:Firmicute plasmid replication protein (RepL)